MRTIGVVLVAVGCTKPTPAPVAPAVEIAGVDYVWKITGHTLLAGSSLSEEDARAWNGREITITSSSYASPFQGTCDEAARSRRNRPFADVVLEVGAPRSLLTTSDLGDEVIEYKLSCRERVRPPLAMFVDGERAMTCFGGVCYFLRR